VAALGVGRPPPGPNRGLDGVAQTIVVIAAAVGHSTHCAARRASADPLTACRSGHVKWTGRRHRGRRPGRPSAPAPPSSRPRARKRAALSIRGTPPALSGPGTPHPPPTEQGQPLAMSYPIALLNNPTW